MAQPDLSKIVSVIMENPKLVEEIREMVSRSENSPEEAKSEPEEDLSEKSAAVFKEEPYQAAGHQLSHSARRNELLRAMQPYVSKERSRAIESMITVADLLLTFKEK